jgi:UDP-N-acetylmuramate--alanine ligase
MLPIELNLPGRHNMLNALAAIAVGLELGVDEDAIHRALASSRASGGASSSATARIRGERDMTLIDDYGHHPRRSPPPWPRPAAAGPSGAWCWCSSRIATAAPRSSSTTSCRCSPSRTCWCCARSTPAGEQPIPGADGRSLARAIRTRGRLDPLFAPEIGEVPELLDATLLDGDVVLGVRRRRHRRLAARLPHC